jgi:hypothetical protein
MSSRSPLPWVSFAGALFLFAPSEAGAQWQGAVYLGGNYTHSASVTIDQPALGRTLTFDDVDYSARPLASPQYYGWRFGWLFGARRRLGVELEFIHLKVISETDRTYPISGSGAPDSPAPMNAIVQRYAMTHGLNFVLINFVSRTPLGEGPLTLVLRSGAGPTLPHAESTIDGQIREQYEYAGIGAQASAGLDLRVHAHVSVVMDYKFTVARPKIDIPQGTGRMTAATHQLAVGLAFGRPH